MGLFTPIDFVDTVHIPGNNGGALFGYTAAEPTSGIVYVIGQDNPGVLKLLQPEPGRARHVSGAGGLSARVPGLPRPGPRRHRNGADAA